MVKFITRTICLALVTMLCAGGLTAQTPEEKCVTGPKTIKSEKIAIADFATMQQYSVNRDVILSEGFEGGSLPTGWTMSNTGSGSNWEMVDGLYSNGVQTVWAPEGNWFATNLWAEGATRNAWLFSSGMNLTQGNSYTISFYLKLAGFPSYSEYDYFEVKIGQSASAAGMTDEIYYNTNTYVPNWTKMEFTFTPTATGTYYLGFHAFTPADLGNDIDIDDVEVTGDVEDNPCPEVTNLEAEVQGTDAILTWDAASGSPTGYKVYRGATSLGTTTELTYTATGLPAGESTLSVEALYNDDCTPKKVDVTVKVGNCDGVSNLSVAIDGSCNATITWDAATKLRSDLLWDNTAGGSQTGYHNVVWKDDPNGARLVQADDFIVTGNGWIIEEVYAYGFNQTSSGIYPVPEYMGIAIYEDSGNNTPKLPAIYENNALTASSGENTGEMTIPLTESFTITETGKYWISIYGVHSGSMDGSKQFWTTISPTAKESPLCRWDPANTYGTSPYYPNWAPNEDTGYPSCVFSISGQTVSNPGVSTYNVYRDGVKIAGPIEETTYTDENVTEGVEYEWAVAVVCANGADSEWSRITDICGNPPCPTVGKVSAEFNADCTEASIIWTVPEGENLKYTVKRDGNIICENITENQCKETAETPFPQGDYIWTIITICPDGESEPKDVTATAPCSEGISELEESVRIYPNPASTVVTINAKDLTKVEVYNTVGQLVEVRTGHVQSVDVSAYNTGIYFFRVYDSNNNVVTKRILVSR